MDFSCGSKTWGKEIQYVTLGDVDEHRSRAALACHLTFHNMEGTYDLGSILKVTGVNEMVSCIVYVRHRLTCGAPDLLLARGTRVVNKTHGHNQ